MKLPQYVEICPVCNGDGVRKQVYTAGCGMGSYEDFGPCDYCPHPEGHLSNYMRGLGYRMKSGDPVPLSVINQIKVINNEQNT